MGRSRTVGAGLTVAGVWLALAPFAAAYLGRAGRPPAGQLVWQSPLTLLLLLGGAFLLVAGGTAVARDTTRALTPAVAAVVPALLCLLLVAHQFAPDPPPIDSIGSEPQRTAWELVWLNVFQGLGAQSIAAGTLAVAGAAAAREQWRWVAAALVGCLGLTLVSTGLVTPGPVGSVLGPLALVAAVGLLPFLAGWRFASPRTA